MQLIKRLREHVTTDNKKESASADIPPSHVYSILQNERRRHIVQFLVTMDGRKTDAGEIADYKAELGEDRQHAYISAIQQHLPRLARSGMVDYDQNRKTVTALPVLKTVWEAHRAVEEKLC